MRPTTLLHTGDAHLARPAHPRSASISIARDAPAAVRNECIAAQPARATGGQGTSHVRGYLEEGSDVVIADVRDDLGEALAAEARDHSLFVHLGVTSESDWAAAIGAADDRLCPVSILVNNDGIGSPLR